jgi:hypothetical protein
MAMSPLQKEYRKFFRDLLKEKEISSLGELNVEGILTFFRDLKRKWKKHKKDNGIVVESNAQALMTAEIVSMAHVQLILEVSKQAADECLVKLLEYVQALGNPGHSFSIVVDPESSESKETFYFDGDGASAIYDIKSKDLVT